MDVCHIRQRAYLQRPDVSRQPVTHDGDELRMDLVLVLLVVLHSRVPVSKYTNRRCKAKRGSRTRLSLSNSMSMTACFWLRCRRKVSRIYGISAIIIESDWDAKARQKTNVR